MSPPAGGHKGRPYFRGSSPAGCFAALGRRGGCPHPPGAGRWPGGAGRRGRRPLQRSAAAGTARPKCSVGEGLVPARRRPQGPPLLLGFRLRRAILRRLDVGAGAHTRPQAVRQDKAPASGGTPCAGALLPPEEVIRMANYTQHYHLHQWEPEDSFLRRDFNEDFQKIDAGLAGRGDCSLLFGSYVGTGP